MHTVLFYFSFLFSYKLEKGMHITIFHPGSKETFLTKLGRYVVFLKKRLTAIKDTSTVFIFNTPLSAKMLVIADQY